MSKPTRKEVDEALARLGRAHGILACSIRTFDEDVVSNEQAELSQALEGALDLLNAGYAVLSQAHEEAPIGAVS